MARSPDILEDRTPLDGTQVDVRVRIAWLLRSWRTVGRSGSPISVTEMATRLKEHGTPASPPSVSGWETGRVAPGPAVIEGYEAVLGLEPGSLRAVVDLVRRRFGDDGPRSPVPPAGLADLDAAVDRVTGASPPPGIAWLHFSEAALAVQPGLPRAFVLPLVTQLLSEVSRSAFTPYVTRYEALALLRSSRYADVLAEAIAAFFDEPGSLMLGDGSALLAERPDARAVQVLAHRLVEPEFLRLRAGVVGLQHIANTRVTAASLWRPMVDPFAEAWAQARTDAPRRQQLGDLWRVLPSGVRKTISARVRTPVSSDPAPRAWEPGGLDDQLDFCGRTAGAAAGAVGLPAQPLLARLLYEAVFEHRYARRLTSSLLVMASPFRAHTALELGRAAHEHDDAGFRRAAAALLVLIGHEETHDTARRLLDSDDAAVVTGALFALMHSRGEIETAHLEALLRLPEPLDRRAVFYAGMTGHPVLDRIAADPHHPLREVACWWQRHGRAIQA